MKFFIRFLLISSLSIIIAERIAYPYTSQIETFIREDSPSLIGLPSTIKLLEGGEIFRDDFTLVWKGKYKDTVDVAIKIFNIKHTFEREKQAYERLNATADNFDFMMHRIPKVYYQGPIFDDFDAIVMTLFEDNLANHFERQGGHFSDSTILLIFKQVIEALKYIHSKGVLHNHIILRNIFIHGQRLFIADFNLSILDAHEYLVSDHKRLFKIIWLMVDNCNESRGSTHRKLACFINRTVQKAFRDIVNTDVIRIGNYAQPDYEKIIERADKALKEIAAESEPVQFDWLKKRNNPSSGESSGDKRKRR